MILIIDMSYKKDSLSLYEFVKPIANIVRATDDFAIKHFSEINENDIGSSEKVILCGTALKDNNFLCALEKFEWIRQFENPVLGICAGMEVIAKVLGCDIVRRSEIGMTKIRIVKQDVLLSGRKEFDAYELHNLSVVPTKDFEILAESNICIQTIKHKRKPIYGIMFHPEVRNEWVVKNFINLPKHC